MNEKDLVKLSVLVIVVGLVLLYLVSVNISYQDVKIGELSRSHIGKLVRIEGEVVSIYGEHDRFIELRDDTGKIKVVLWSDTLEELELSGMEEIIEGAKIEVKGTVELYRNELEFFPLKSQVRLL